MVRRVDHPRRLAVALLLLAVLALGAGAGYRAYTLYEDVLGARALATAALGRLAAGGATIPAEEAYRALAELRAAAVRFDRLDAALTGDPVVALARLVPGVDRQLAAAHRIVRAVRTLALVLPDVEKLAAGYLDARDSRSGPDRAGALMRVMASSQASIERLDTATATARDLVAAVPDEGLLPQLAESRRTLLERLDDARRLLAPLRNVDPALLALAGEPEPRRYLLLALDNAELRPAGGYTGAYGFVTFDRGTMTELRFHDVFEIDYRSGHTYVAPPGPLAGRLLGDDAWQLADAGWSPDFPTSAIDSLRLYRLESGDTSPIDGVIGFTPQAVDAILSVTGPVEVPEAGLTIGAGETYLISLQQVEFFHQGPERKLFLDQLAQRVVAAVFALPVERYPALLAALEEAARRRHLQVWLSDPAEQRAVGERGWAGRFGCPADGDHLAVVDANVAPVSKLNLITEMTHRLDVALEPSGAARETLVTTWTNTFTDPPAPHLATVRGAFRSGILGSFVRRYLPSGAILEAVSSDGVPPLTDPETSEPELGCLAVGNYQLVRAGATSLTTRYRVPDVARPDAEGDGQTWTYRLTFRKQAGRDRDRLEVAVTVPEGATPLAWSQGARSNGRTVTFSTTTEYDRFFEVVYRLP